MISGRLSYQGFQEMGRWSVHTGNFHPVYQDLCGKNEDLGNWASLASHMNTSKFLLGKEWRGKI